MTVIADARIDDLGIGILTKGQCMTSVSVDKAPSPCQRSRPNRKRQMPRGIMGTHRSVGNNGNLLLPDLQRDTIEMVERYQIIDGVRTSLPPSGVMAEAYDHNVSPGCTVYTTTGVARVSDLRACRHHQNTSCRVKTPSLRASSEHHDLGTPIIESACIAARRTTSPEPSPLNTDPS